MPLLMTGRAWRTAPPENCLGAATKQHLDLYYPIERVEVGEDLARPSQAQILA